MKFILKSTLAAAAIAAGTASIAAADTYVYTQSASAPMSYDYSYTYGPGYNYTVVPNTGTYDRYSNRSMPMITNPGGEGGGVQNPRLGSGINGSATGE